MSILTLIPGTEENTKYQQDKKIREIREDMTKSVNLTEYKGNVYVTIEGVPSFLVTDLQDSAKKLDDVRRLRFEYLTEKQFPGCNAKW